MKCSDVDVVVLKGGVTVPLPALQLAWQLEHRGITVIEDGDGLVVRPRQCLTDEDRAAIRAWRDALRVIARYRADEVIA